MLKGQAKKDYQRRYMRDYMRDYRLQKQGVKTPQLRPWAEVLTTNSPDITVDADGNIVPEYT